MSNLGTDLWLFLKGLVRYWTSFLTGSVLIAVLWIMEKLSWLSLPKWVVGAIVFLSGVVAAFRTWRDRQEEVDRLVREGQRLLEMVSGKHAAERRAVYDGLREFRNRVLIDCVPTIQEIGKLHSLREESLLLFGAEIVGYIDEWISHAAALATAKDILKHPVEGKDHSNWVEKDYQASSFFGKQYGEEIAGRFRPYIGAPLP